MTIDISSFPVESWPVTKIKPYPFNHKVHPEKQISDLARSISAQGLLDPIAIDEDGVIISGHGRFEAIKRLGRDFASVRVLRGLSENDKTALRISANKTASNEYDDDMLAHEVGKLNEADFDLTILGMSNEELDVLIDSFGDGLDIEDVVEDPYADRPLAPQAPKKTKVAKALGFDAISDEASEKIKAFMVQIEQDSGKEGLAAFMEHVEGVIEEATYG